MNTVPSRLPTTLAALSILAAVGLASSKAHAQWTVTSLNDASSFPSGNAAVAGIHAGKQVGSAPNVSGGASYARLWRGGGQVPVVLHPAVATSSAANAVHNGWQAGFVRVNNVNLASLWQGTADSWLSLHPTGASNSTALGIHAGQQVGHTGVTTTARAALWTGTAESWVDLHPADAAFSQALAVHADQQVGFARIGTSDHASLWTGTPESWVDLHPAGASHSRVTGVWDGQQVGNATFSGVEHGGTWAGTPESWVSLGECAVMATHGGWQAGAFTGDTIFGPRYKACIWRGTPESREDLSVTLGELYAFGSRATGIWSDGTTLYVVGTGTTMVWSQSQGTFPETDAFLWTRAIPCPSDWDRVGGVNSADISAFLGSWLAGVQGATLEGDFNHDELLNSSDISGFLTAWLSDVTGGC